MNAFQSPSGAFPLRQGIRTQPLLVLVGPPGDKPCGILDYVQRLLPELSQFGPVTACSYEQALTLAKSHSGEEWFLVHYERSRVPRSQYLRTLSRWVGNRLFIVPHEVYWEDPFAFPMSRLTAPWPLSGVQKALYRWRHRPWFRETALQKQGYGAHTVFPLNQGTADILVARGMQTPWQIIPHARLDAFPVTTATPAMADMDFIWGLPGFITANNDYETVLQGLTRLPTHALVFLGSERDPNLIQTRKWKERVQALGLSHRVQWAGYIPESDWPKHLASVDGFVAPFKHRSASGSLFLAMAARKPILAANMGLTREMVALGAPLQLVGQDDWTTAMEQTAKGQAIAPPDTYAWTYAKVAQAYWQAMQAALERPGRNSNAADQ
jgi:glycosyltransferase involved in cell wall biosynthesis